MSEDKGNVIEFTGSTTNDVPVDWLLEKAKSWGAKHVVVIAEAEDGTVSGSSSMANAQHMNWLLDKAKRNLFDIWTK